MFSIGQASWSKSFVITAMNKPLAELNSMRHRTFLYLTTTRKPPLGLPSQVLFSIQRLIKKSAYKILQVPYQGFHLPEASSPGPALQNFRFSQTWGVPFSSILKIYHLQYVRWHFRAPMPSNIIETTFQPES